MGLFERDIRTATGLALLEVPDQHLRDYEVEPRRGNNGR